MGLKQAKGWIISGMVVTAILFSNGCGGSSSGTLQSITVSPSSQAVNVGSTQQFTATGSFSNNSTKDLTSSVKWSSSNTAAVTISSGGLATAANQGGSQIVATSGSITGTSGMCVGLQGLVVTPNNPQLSVGQTAQLTATGLFSVADQDVTSAVNWSSSNTNIATVSSTGLVTAVNAGNANITASSGSLNSTIEVIVQ
jgi:uncharacterized protein YjdB